MLDMKAKFSNSCAILCVQAQEYQEKEVGVKSDEVDGSKALLDAQKVDDSKPKKPVGMFRIYLI